MFKISRILLYILDIIIISSPTIGYIDTMRIMIKTRHSDFYNINTILVIFFAQGTKVLFYFYHRYATRIFCQAIMLLLSATILTLLKFLYCEKKEKPQIHKEGRPENQNEHRRNSIDHRRDSIVHRRESIDHISYTYQHKKFLKIFNIASSETLLDFISSYVLYFLIVYSTFIIFYSMFGSITVDFLGIISNLAEAATSFPTFIRIVIHQDALTTSPLLVLQYLFGDVLKIAVYSISKAPWSFFFGAFCQLSVDIFTNIYFLRIYIRLSKKKQSKSENSPLIEVIRGGEESVNEEEDLKQP